MSKRFSARRAATFLAAFGVLVMSSGVALMVAATPANAAPGDKVVVCKYVSTPGGELDHIVVVADDTLPDEFNGTFPFIWTDAQGQSESGSIAVRYAAEGEQAHEVPLTDCPQEEEPEPTLATASVTAIQPTCENGNVADYTTSGANVTFGESAAPAPGASITVTATATGDAEFEGGATTKDFPLVFNAAEGDCDPDVVVDPPTVVVDPPAQTPTVSTPTTPTVVSAGLTGATPDLRGEQGLALVFAGMVMLLGAGGLGLRVRRGSSLI